MCFQFRCGSRLCRDTLGAAMRPFLEHVRLAALRTRKTAKGHRLLPTTVKCAVLYRYRSQMNA